MKLSAALLFLATAYAADPHMTNEERTQLIQYMKDSQKEFVAAVSSLSDEQWKWKPAPERWSVGECAEHIMLSETALFSKAQEALKNPPSSDWETTTGPKTAILLQVMAPRLGKAQAPEEIQPTGKFTRAQIMVQFAEVRARSLTFVETTDIALKEHVTAHPFPIFNPLNAYQWVLYIPLHNMRHDKQIEEVKATAGFPAK
jgi:hypothetical protein